MTFLRQNKQSAVLIFSVFIAGLCSIIYELLIGTTSSYFLGDSIKQFSLTIGQYMAAMGIGSYVSRFLNKHLLEKFIGIEILLGFLGGISVPVLYLSFAYTDFFAEMKLFFVMTIGILIGLEIPLLARLLAKHYVLKINISNILSLDYLGALIATSLFPFILLPFLGTFKSSLLFGLINMSIGVATLWVFSENIRASQKKILYVFLSLVTLLLAITLLCSQGLLRHWHNTAFEDRVVFSKQSPHQSIVITKNKEDIRLFLNGSLQFSSIDEYRYHESLVHIPFAIGENIQQVLILGGGDGLAVREVLKHASVVRITLVDLDPIVTELGRKNTYLQKLNQGSLEHDKVKIIHKDAFVFVKESLHRYDLIILDLPDPSTASLARLYSLEFYKYLKNRLKPHGVFVTQATSPFYAKQTFWCIHRTIEQVLTYVYPYHVNIPSFGQWGFVMATQQPVDIHQLALKGVQTRFLDAQVMAKAFVFEKDLLLQDGLQENLPYSSLDTPNVLSYYLREWKYWH